MDYPLKKWPSSLKALATCYLVTILLGYAVSLTQIYHRTTFNMHKAVTYYRGEENNPEAMLLPQSFATLLSVAHVHTLSQPLLFFVLGLLFCFSLKTQKTKSLFIVLTFLGSILSNLSPWLLRYAHPIFVYLFPLSQIMIFVGLLYMSLVCLKELWLPPPST